MEIRALRAVHRLLCHGNFVRNVAWNLDDCSKDTTRATSPVGMEYSRLYAIVELFYGK